jgi:hypothetical protein
MFAAKRRTGSQVPPVDASTTRKALSSAPHAATADSAKDSAPSEVGRGVGLEGEAGRWPELLPASAQRRASRCPSPETTPNRPGHIRPYQVCKTRPALPAPTSSLLPGNFEKTDMAGYGHVDKARHAWPAAGHIMAPLATSRYGQKLRTV